MSEEAEPAEDGLNAQRAKCAEKIDYSLRSLRSLRLIRSLRPPPSLRHWRGPAPADYALNVLTRGSEQPRTIAQESFHENPYAPRLGSEFRGSSAARGTPTGRMRPCWQRAVNMRRHRP